MSSAVMGPLVEYLLAQRKNNGRRLARFGGVTTTVTSFPPGATATFAISPYFGSFANIEFYIKPSPAMVPGAFSWQSVQAGMELIIGTIRDTIISEGHPLWLEYTAAEPIYTQIQNISGVTQFFEVFDQFLIVENPEDLIEIRRICAEYGAVGRSGGGSGTPEGITETNTILRQMRDALQAIEVKR